MDFNPDTALGTAALMVFALASVLLSSGSGMARLVAGMARDYQVAAADLAPLVPAWCRFLPLVRAVKWLALAAAAYWAGWLPAGVAFVLGFGLFALLPLGFRAYEARFRKAVARLAVDEPERAARLGNLLDLVRASSAR